ncbi:TetR/AcrR family transcriptional regulator [Enterococcus termitis]
MPKVITEYERQQTRNAIIEHTRNLIYQRKGINNFTVDDIVRSARLGKAKFYSYFDSKEECLFEVVELSYKEQLEGFTLIMDSDDSLRNKMIRFLKEIYLSETSINNYFSLKILSWFYENFLLNLLRRKKE